MSCYLILRRSVAPFRICGSMLFISSPLRWIKLLFQHQKKVDVLNIFRVFWPRFTKLVLACAHDVSTNELSAKAIFFDNRNVRLTIQLVHTVDQYKLNK